MVRAMLLRVLNWVNELKTCLHKKEASFMLLRVLNWVKELMACLHKKEASFMWVALCLALNRSWLFIDVYDGYLLMFMMGLPKVNMKEFIVTKQHLFLMQIGL